MKLKLEQGQMWRQDTNLIRLVRLERLAVEYKSINDESTGGGTHHRVTKKEFCRLIKPLPRVTEMESTPAPEA
ncbi:MAG: hypothetical protein V4726_22115 [Verrucomicrobiota bacterium]